MKGNKTHKSYNQHGLTLIGSSTKADLKPVQQHSCDRQIARRKFKSQDFHKGSEVKSELKQKGFDGTLPLQLFIVWFLRKITSKINLTLKPIFLGLCLFFNNALLLNSK